MIDHNIIRKKIEDFFIKNAHTYVPGIPLVPQNDPTTLFTGSGMQQFVPNLQGEPHPQGRRVFNIQRCVRVQDIEEVGDNRHDTFFEMVGNWSFGDYFKAQQLPWMFDLYTNREYGFGLDPQKLYVTVFSGGDGVAQDAESVAIWQQIFAQHKIACTVGTADTWDSDQHITIYEASKNWWSRAGAPARMPIGEIGGPDSELFYDFGVEHQDLSVDPGIHPNSDSGRFMEIGNSVFIQYFKNKQGQMQELPQQNVDFGGGFERILAAIGNNPDVFETSVFRPIVDIIAPHYSKLSEADKKPYRIIADHIKTATQMAADGIAPGPKEQAYVARRLLRRALAKANAQSISKEKLISCVGAVQSIYGPSYEAILNPQVVKTIGDELEKFDKMLVGGRKQIIKEIKELSLVDGAKVFDLYQKTGVPQDVILEIAQLEGKTATIAGFEEARLAHSASSKSQSEAKFKGGLADSSEQVLKYHTTTHILNAALTQIIGSDVRQEGSNITGERLRFDFFTTQVAIREQLPAIEAQINKVIESDLPVNFVVMPKAQAQTIGAKSFFREKYPDNVKVYFIGDTLETAISKEFCGGPHVTRTSQIGKISVYKLEKIGSNIYRIYAK